MIEVIIDFDEINIKNINKYNDIEYKLGMYLYKKLNIGPKNLPQEDPIGRGIVWDAFSDNFAELFFKLPPEDYKYSENDEWCWKNKKEYEQYIKYYNSIGLKNEQGKRDDMRLIFVNFYSFFEKYISISNNLLEVILDYINLSSKEEDEECLKFHWHKMVLEIRS